MAAVRQALAAKRRLAQLVEHLSYTQQVTGSIPVSPSCLERIINKLTTVSTSARKASGNRCFSYTGGKMTDKEVKHFYNTAEWKSKREQILNRDFHECQDCRRRLAEAMKKGIVLHGEDRIIRPAHEVHHIKELKEHPELALVDKNLISLCTQCHNIRHGRNPHRFVKRKKRLTEEKW